MTFTTKRGRPAKKAENLQLIEGGKPQQTEVEIKRPVVKIRREPIDICHAKGIISDEEHWSAIHFRWLYTVRFGAPGVSAIDLHKMIGKSCGEHDEAWQESREREYAMAVEKLRKCGALKIILNIAVFGHFPRFMPSARISKKNFSYQAINELEKLREGLDVLANHWNRYIKK